MVNPITVILSKLLSVVPVCLCNLVFCVDPNTCLFSILRSFHNGASNWPAWSWILRVAMSCSDGLCFLWGGLPVPVMWPPSPIFFDFTEAKVQKSFKFWKCTLSLPQHYSHPPQFPPPHPTPPPQHRCLGQSWKSSLECTAGCSGHFGVGCSRRWGEEVQGFQQMCY